LKFLQINTVVNSGSTGRIAEEIGQLVMAKGHESYIAYGRGGDNSKSQLLKIGTYRGVVAHKLQTAITDRHGFGSRMATQSFIEKVDRIQPDVVGLHNIHGYYLNIAVLMQYLAKAKPPVVWTFHDCWPFTGHCTFFEGVHEEPDCMKWQTQCNQCPKKRRYPASYLLDNSRQNFEDKKRLFSALENLTIVTPSKWLAGLVKQSFLQEKSVRVIHNGIDLNRFKPTAFQTAVNKYQINTNKKIVLGVASVWDRRKGLSEFVQLANLLPAEYQIVLVGLNAKQLQNLPTNIVGVPRTESVEELAALYSGADVFVNPTFLDNFPTTNIEALACGTPVITYDTGGSPEAIDRDTGVTIPKKDINGLHLAIQKWCNTRDQHSSACRSRAERLFNKEDRYQDYLKLYENVARASASTASMR